VGQTVTVRSFKFKGNTLLTSEALTAALAGLVGRPIDFARLQSSAAMVTDHYRVHDAAALAASVASQPDVSGDAAQGWHRQVEGSDGAQRSQSTINPGRSTDRVERFHRTQRLADTGRAWFQGVAGAGGRQRREPHSPSFLQKHT
jgi:outer membrane protein assembly factor BamA